MKQLDIFGKLSQTGEENKGYTKKIKAPIYEPKNERPHHLELYDTTKYNRLVARINSADIPEEEKQFLIFAATRHIVFNYQKIADYYAHSSKEVQELMEQSALVIIDFDKAIENGFTRMSYEVAQRFTTDVQTELERR